MTSIFAALTALITGLTTGTPRPTEVAPPPQPETAPLKRPTPTKLLRRLEARARRDYPGHPEAWYRQRAMQILNRYRD